ncbi:GntR family transcriptional regulator [Cumulibacter manganitolerans]|uniref:GntR family transcriptional regulator n=1 Tax=Cumulibacter manganitolerans TaxID=1884992 RepID=UPI001296BAE2|nr:GntR family transcriptional regulator [Cumulibacter manganitolerans]
MNQARDAYDRIRDAIVEGRIPPSERLIEQRLAAELSLSRTPIREALRRLQAEGLVESKTNRGAIVRPVSEEEIHDFYEMRCRLEAYATELAAQRATPELVELLRADAAEFEQVVESSDATTESIRLVNAANKKLHGRIVEAARHPRLAQLLGQAVDAPLVFAAFRRYDLDERRRSAQFHRMIVEAIATGEDRRAGNLMAEHILQGRDALLH